MIDQVSIARRYGAGLETSSVSRTTGAEAASNAEPGQDFASVLSNMISTSIDTVRQGEQTAAAGVKGQASVQQVVEAVMSAEQSLQSTLAIRDKIVQAYLEISRMQI